MKKKSVTNTTHPTSWYTRYVKTMMCRGAIHRKGKKRKAWVGERRDGREGGMGGMGGRGDGREGREG